MENLTLTQDMLQGENAEELVLESQLVDCSGFRGSLKPGIGECVLLFNSTPFLFVLV